MNLKKTQLFYKHCYCQDEKNDTDTYLSFHLAQAFGTEKGFVKVAGEDRSPTNGK